MKIEDDYMHTNIFFIFAMITYVVEDPFARHLNRIKLSIGVSDDFN